MLPRLHCGSRAEKAAETSCELLAGIGGHDLQWETSSDQRRAILHLVFAGASLRLARHAGMGAVDDFAVAAAEAHPADSRLWILRCRDQGKAERITGSTAEGTAEPSACIPAIERRGGMAGDPSRQERSL